MYINLIIASEIETVRLAGKLHEIENCRPCGKLWEGAVDQVDHPWRLHKWTNLYL